MRVLTFAPALTITEDQDGGLSARGFPMTSGYVEVLPADITVPVVVAVCALGGDEYSPVLYIGADSPSGERISTMEFGWDWEDSSEIPIKFRVFAQYLPITVETEGVYTLGLYNSLEDTDAEAVFPLPMFLNPLARPDSGA